MELASFAITLGAGMVPLDDGDSSWVAVSAGEPVMDPANSAYFDGEIKFWIVLDTDGLALPVIVMSGVTAFVEASVLVYTAAFVTQPTVRAFSVAEMRLQTFSTRLTRALRLLTFDVTCCSISPPVRHEWDVLRPTEHRAPSIHSGVSSYIRLRFLPETIECSIEEALGEYL